MTNKELLNKYNTLVAKCKDMEENFTQKDKQWQDEAKKNKITEDALRKLCNTILAKDRDVHTLDNSVNYNKMSTIELVNATMQSYKKYNKKRSQLMSDILDTAEDRQKEIESLTSQLSRANNQLNEQSKEDKNTEKTSTNAQSAKNNNAEKPKTTENNTKTSHSDKNNSSLIIYSNDDDDDFDVPTMNSPVTQTYRNSPSKEQRKKQREKKIANEYRKVLDYNEVIEKFGGKNSIMSMLFEYIGKGYSDFKEIKDEILKRSQKNAKTLYRSLKVAGEELKRLNFVNIKSVTVPVPPSTLMIFEMTEIGIDFYKHYFNKVPEIQECIKIRQNHDNYIHGYAIKILYDSLKESNLYSGLDMYCRQNNKQWDIQCNKANKKYIPDVYGKFKGTQEECFFEYEHGKTKECDMIDKLQKMASITNHIYIIEDNVQNVENVAQNVLHFQQQHKKHALGVKVHLTTLKKFKSEQCNILSDQIWIQTIEC